MAATATKRPDPAAAIAAVRQRGSYKRDLVRIVLQEAVSQGRLLSKAEVTRRARVSKDLVDAMHAEYAEAMEHVKVALRGSTKASAEVTAASLRAQLDHYRELHRREEKRTDALERRLGVLLGQQITGELAAPSAVMLPTDQKLQRRITELESENGELSNTLTAVQAELARVRKVNTQLMRQQNIAPPADA